MRFVVKYRIVEYSKHIGDHRALLMHNSVINGQQVSLANGVIHVGVDARKRAST